MHTIEKVHILIVEDDRFIRRVYREILKDIEKIDIHELESAENAIEHIRQYKPDIVIMDYKLPGMNGLEATKQIVMAHPDTIVLFISGDSDEQLEEEVLEIGAISFLRKPVRGKLLFFTIMNFVEIIRTKKELKRQIEQATANNEKVKAERKPTPTEPVSVCEKSEMFLDSFENKSIDMEKQSILSSDENAISASEYIAGSGGDISEDIEDLMDSYESLKYTVDALETFVEAYILREISDRIKETESKLARLTEFTAIQQTLASINNFMNAQDIEKMRDIPMKKLAVFLSDFFQMFDEWLRSVFVNQTAKDIHYMDITLMSFGLQMDSIFSDINVLSEDDATAVDEGGSVEFF